MQQQQHKNKYECKHLNPHIYYIVFNFIFFFLHYERLGVQACERV